MSRVLVLERVVFAIRTFGTIESHDVLNCIVGQNLVSTKRDNVALLLLNGIRHIKSGWQLH